MCIIIVANANKKISNRIIKQAYKNNPDGFGIAASVNGKVKVIKGLYKPNKIIKIYNQLRERATGDIVLHFRLATHGNITNSLCHPFRVNDDLVMFHNGIIDSKLVGWTKDYIDESDSSLFCKNILRKFKRGFECNDYILNMLGDFIGYYNKVCLLNSLGEVSYINKDEWITYRNITYSNDSLLPIEYTSLFDFNEEYEEYKDNIDYYKDYEDVTMGDNYDYVNYGRMDEYYDDRIFN